MGGVAKYHSAEKYVFLLLLFTAAVIPVNQVFTLLMVAVTFFAGLAVAVKYRKLKRVPVLPRVQQGLLYLLLAITWYSLRFSADKVLCRKVLPPISRMKAGKRECSFSS